MEVGVAVGMLDRKNGTSRLYWFFFQREAHYSESKKSKVHITRPCPFLDNSFGNHGENQTKTQRVTEEEEAAELALKQRQEQKY